MLYRKSIFIKICNLTVIFLVLCLILFLIYPTGYFVLNHRQSVHIGPVPIIPSSVGAYIINLDRSRDRYDEVKPLVSHLEVPLERVSAIEGQALSDTELNQSVDLGMYQTFFRQPPKKGTIGCSMSHIKAWQTFLHSPFEYAIIFEDDVRFDPKKLKAAMNQLIEHPSYWDINNFETHHRGLPITIKTLKDNQKLVSYLLPVTHTGAYMINRKAAMRLLEKALPIKMPVDHYFTRVWEFGLIFTGIENPRLVYQKPGVSEIENSTRVLRGDQKKNLSIKQTFYLIKTGIIRIVYNLKCILTSHDR